MLPLLFFFLVRNEKIKTQLKESERERENKGEEEEKKNAKLNEIRYTEMKKQATEKAPEEEEMKFVGYFINFVVFRRRR